MTKWLYLIKSNLGLIIPTIVAVAIFSPIANAISPDIQLTEKACALDSSVRLLSCDEAYAQQRNQCARSNDQGACIRKAQDQHEFCRTIMRLLDGEITCADKYALAHLLCGLIYTRDFEELYACRRRVEEMFGA